MFVGLFALLIARTFWVQVVDGPRLAADPHNPRVALLAEHRGSILASDGRVLAHTVAGHRKYPEGGSLAHVVGYASARYGTSGIEDAYDRVLTPVQSPNDPAAQLRSLGDALGQGAATPKGGDVVTTLDMPIQHALVAELRLHPRAAGVVMDPRSGAILALASIPTFDPNSIDEIFPQLVKASASPLLDRALDGLYPPGSTFKIVTVADALDSGVVDPNSTFNDSGGFPVGNFVVRNDESEVTGTQDLTGAFALSSNVDFAQIGLQLGLDRWYDYASRWKLGEPLYFQLPAARDRIPAKATVSPSILAQLAFGQADLLVTPLRMALVASTIANGGVEPRPYVVRSVKQAYGEASATQPARLAEPIAPETAETVKALMVAVVQRGTGRAAALSGVTVAGKTGTATNPAGKAHSWFVAFAPAEAPRVALAIVVENAGYGGAVSAPIARDVLRVALSRLRM